MNKDIDLKRSKSDDGDLASKPRLLLANQVRSNSTGSFRSNSLDRFLRRAEKVWAVSTIEKKDVESQKPILESNEPILESNQGTVEEEEKVGDLVQVGQHNYFIVDIFEKEIMELGDKVDLNFKTFNNFEVVDGGAPLDHHFYKYKCCYSSCFCFCTNINVEREWVILKRQLALWDKKEVSFCVRTYTERKELMRVAATVTNGDQSHSLFFFDIKFPKKYPYQAPSFFYHPYGLPLSNLGTKKKLRPQLRYNILDVFLHIEEIVMMNTTNKSCRQMLDMLKQPPMGFEDFVKGHFRKKGAFILKNMMDEMDLDKESDKNMFLKTYIALEDNKAYCEHLLNSDLKEELERFKEKESSLCEHSRFNDNQETSRHQNSWTKYSFL
ncbi:uncharacterized protein BNAA03G32430D [Brassica napus]|uniref:(rape) hypothetical protein n=1 Tax=Brassica napus TaxID=3708 RepID=A0A816VSJ1_BRANA|nr:uncharacterized protein BNAA03G32430D [Brassica napus]CAF2127350.1 unnamed protein product [Brassica napus]